MRNIYILLLLTFGFGQDYSLQFDGVDDYVELDTTNLNTSADFTVQFDVIDYGYNSHGNNEWKWRVYFSNLGSDGNSYAGIAVYSRDNYITFFYNEPPNQIDVVERPSDNSFNLAISYNQSIIKFYIDGSLVNEYGATINYSEVSKFIIGSRPQYQSCDNECGLIGDCLNGNIDNFNFWNYELNQESIQSNIDNSVSTDDAGLVGSWNFNEGSGAILYDQSGNENHGTIQGNPEWLCNDIIDACGVCGGDDSSCSGCTDPEACNYDESATADDGSCAYEIDCAGTCGGDLELDCGGVCGGDNSTALNCCGLPFYDDCTDDCYIDSLGACCIEEDADECGLCFGDGTSCNENIFECLSDCPNYDEVYEDIELGNDCLVCGEFIDFVLFDDCSEDCESELLYMLWAECDMECNVWDNQSDCQGSSCIWDDSNLQCVDWPYYTECSEIYDEAYNLGFEEGGSIGAQSGDANGDGTLDVLDIVYFIDVILNP